MTTSDIEGAINKLVQKNCYYYVTDHSWTEVLTQPTGHSLSAMKSRPLLGTHPELMLSM
jgi:hypothetical protein